MTVSFSPALDAAIRSLPQRYPGPGGAVAVLHRGEVIIRHSWGYANAERRLPFTPSTLFRMCSITKQFTCAAMLQNTAAPSELNKIISSRLPLLQGPHPNALHLAHNQSGLRDYWAVAMLHGAAIEGYFGDREAERVIRGTRSLQFSPGTSYSYVNQNFRLLSDALQDHTGRSFAEILQFSVFNPSGMERAILAAETRAMPDGTIGYEGSVSAGFRPAINNIWWTGDAGLAASLDDMIAWETFIDNGRDDSDSLYNRLSAPTSFENGTPAPYGFGLQHLNLHGKHVTAHGGALRGWRSHRLHVASERLSVVVMFNHMSPAQNAAAEILGSMLNAPAPPTRNAQTSRLPGVYREQETGLSARIDSLGENTLGLRYLMLPDALSNVSDTHAENGAIRLNLLQDCTVRMEHLKENRSTTLIAATDAGPIPADTETSELAGNYICDELDGATVTVSEQGGILYGGFSGMLGDGKMEPLQRLARDLWVLPCPRALDHTPPGDWTLSFERQNKQIIALRLGCWLARDLIYRPV
ncbi:D-aminopeptidase [Neokomagataea tanensis]|uniref:D-aminopeptidase n=3 Tax=Neokomagataea TaxID=1223423 RepID=A0A4Y6VB80_9PROT|nr:D-aminopeptidase [Neokomagataea thailandica]QDH25811.1 D-aminopeptidase [Neokomagataea tanensis]